MTGYFRDKVSEVHLWCVRVDALRARLSKRTITLYEWYELQELCYTEEKEEAVVILRDPELFALFRRAAMLGPRDRLVLARIIEALLATSGSPPI